MGKTINWPAATINQILKGVETFDEVPKAGSDNPVESNGIEEKLTDIYGAAFVEKSASGDPIVITDGAANIPLASASFDITPVQDLNGYDHPWPPGGSINLLETNPNFTSVTQNGVTCTKNANGTYTLTGTATADTNFAAFAESITFSAGTYYVFLSSTAGGTVLLLDSNYSITQAGTFNVDSGNTRTLTPYLRVANGTTVNQTVYPIISETSISSANDFVPYSNICPIGGFTNATIVVADGETPIEQAQSIVQSGKADLVYPIASQITDTWGSYDAPWDVVNHFDNGDMVIQQHWATPNDMQFDAPEAIYYAGSSGLAAGTYHIPIGVAYGSGWTTDKSIQFTLTANMSADDQLFINFGTNADIDPTASRAWQVFGKGLTTVKQSGTTSNGTSGTSLGTIGATNAYTPNGQLNAISRAVYGYGRWSQSAYRQYVNNYGTAGNWWTAQNPWDRPPSNHASISSWLYNTSEAFRSILQEYPVVTAINTVEGSTEAYETTYDKVFLPSLQEMYITPQLANVEGVDWQYYKDLAAEAGLSGRFAQFGTYAILKKYSISNHSSAVYVRLRSAYRGHAHTAWFVNSYGLVGNWHACTAYRACPACIIQSN